MHWRWSYAGSSVDVRVSLTACGGAQSLRRGWRLWNGPRETVAAKSFSNLSDGLNVWKESLVPPQRSRLGYRCAGGAGCCAGDSGRCGRVGGLLWARSSLCPVENGPEGSDSAARAGWPRLRRSPPALSLGSGGCVRGAEFLSIRPPRAWDRIVHGAGALAMNRGREWVGAQKMTQFPAFMASWTASGRKEGRNRRRW